MSLCDRFDGAGPEVDGDQRVDRFVRGVAMIFRHADQTLMVRVDDEVGKPHALGVRDLNGLMKRGVGRQIEPVDLLVAELDKPDCTSAHDARTASVLVDQAARVERRRHQIDGGGVRVVRGCRSRPWRGSA